MKIISTVVASFALVLSGLAAAPALAADLTVYVDTFVVDSVDPAGDCSFGGGIRFVDDYADNVDWTVNGEPYDWTPQGHTLSLPRGGYVNVTATARPGYTLTELNNNTQGGDERSGDSLSWQHYVSPCVPTSPPSCDTTQADALAVELAVTKAKVERQRATIKRLRAKLAQR